MTIAAVYGFTVFFPQLVTVKFSKYFCIPTSIAGALVPGTKGFAAFI
jgi:hypothetical protein